LNYLLDQGLLDKIASDEAFISIIVRASESARRNHKLAQISRLANTIKNFSKVSDDALKHKFLTWLDGFTDFEFALFNSICSQKVALAEEVLAQVFKSAPAMEAIVMENVAATKYLVRYKHDEVSGEQKLVLTDIGKQFWEYCS